MSRTSLMSAFVILVIYIIRYTLLIIYRSHVLNINILIIYILYRTLLYKVIILIKIYNKFINYNNIFKDIKLN